MEFRLLKADEIEARVATVQQSGCTLLLYKDARCDMNILDETVGSFNWKRAHSRENANCIVSIWDEAKQQWVSKEDVGTESFTEKEKGLASDSFKRACVNWGIGRELYTAPFIWIKDVQITPKKNGIGFDTKDKFKVVKIDYDSKRRISALEIRNETLKKICFKYAAKPKDTAEVVFCPVCGDEVTEMQGKNGLVQPKDVLKACGNKCYKCYKEEQERMKANV